MSGLLRSDPARDPARSLRELAEQIEALLYTTGRQLVPLLGARWVEVSRSTPSGRPLTYQRAGSAQDATRDVRLAVVPLVDPEHRIPHPLGRAPEGVIVVRNSAGATIAEGTHTADYLSLSPSATTTVRLLVF